MKLPLRFLKCGREALRPCRHDNAASRIYEYLLAANCLGISGSQHTYKPVTEDVNLVHNRRGLFRGLQHRKASRLTTYRNRPQIVVSLHSCVYVPRLILIEVVRRRDILPFLKATDQFQVTQDESAVVMPPMQVSK